MEKEKSNKSWSTTLIVFIFLGFLGMHMFYVGRIKSGIFYLLIAILYIPMIGVFRAFVEYSDSAGGVMPNYWISLICFSFIIGYPIGLFIEFIMIIIKKFKDNDGKYVVD